MDDYVTELGQRTEIDMTEFDYNILINKFSILNINIRSIKSNFVYLKSFLQSLKRKVSFIVLTETWLSDEIVDQFKLEGYRHFSQCRNLHGGGVSVFVLNTLKVNIDNSRVCLSHLKLLH